MAMFRLVHVLGEERSGVQTTTGYAVCLIRDMQKIKKKKKKKVFF